MMNNPLRILLVSSGILMLVILSSCDRIEKKSDPQNISIVPLEKPVLAGQLFSFQIKEEIVKENKIYWDFGDGTNASGKSVNHTFINPGIYHISLYLESERGKEKQCCQGLQMPLEKLFKKI